MTYLRWSNSSWYSYRNYQMSGSSKEDQVISIAWNPDEEYALNYNKVKEFLTNPDWDLFKYNELNKRDQEELIEAFNEFVIDVDNAGPKL